MDRRVGQRWMREDQGGTRSLVDCPWSGRPSGTVLLPSVALSVLTHALCIPGAVSDKREERDHGEGSKVVSKAKRPAVKKSEKLKKSEDGSFL